MENHTHNVEQFPLIISTRVTRQDLIRPYSDGFMCPIASALQRQFPELSVYVTTYDVQLWRKAQHGYGLSTPVFIYKLKIADNDKAQSRAGTIWGKIIGGFTVILTHRDIGNLV